MFERKRFMQHALWHLDCHNFVELRIRDENETYSF